MSWSVASRTIAGMFIRSAFWAARRIRDKTKQDAKYREIVDKYYASKWYAMVKGRLGD